MISKLIKLSTVVVAPHAKISNLRYGWFLRAFPKILHMSALRTMINEFYEQNVEKMHAVAPGFVC